MLQKEKNQLNIKEILKNTWQFYFPIKECRCLPQDHDILFKVMTSNSSILTHAKCYNKCLQPLMRAVFPLNGSCAV